MVTSFQSPPSRGCRFSIAKINLWSKKTQCQNGLSTMKAKFPMMLLSAPGSSRAHCPRQTTILKSLNELEDIYEYFIYMLLS